MTTNYEHITEQSPEMDEVYALGRDAAICAASWTVDGNRDAGDYPRLLQMLDDGDPDVWDYLPRTPDLSGEMAGDPTPMGLVDDVGLADAIVDDPEILEIVCDVWETAVSDHFEVEVERVLRAQIDDDGQEMI